MLTMLLNKCVNTRNMKIFPCKALKHNGIYESKRKY